MGRKESNQTNKQMDLSILVGRGYSDGHLIKFLNQVVPPLLKIVMISANHADPAASQLVLYCLPTYFPGVTVPGIQGIKNLSKQFVLKVASGPGCTKLNYLLIMD